MEKTCKKCKINKNISEFHHNKYSKDGHYDHCKSCKGKYDAKYRKSKKVKTYTKSQYYRDRKAEYRKSRDKDPRIQMLVSAKTRAKQLNLTINITIDDIVIPEICPLLNIPIFRKPYGQRGSFLPNSPSLDKIIPELGYVKGNVQVISMKANAMKYNASIEELKTFATNILKNYA